MIMTVNDPIITKARGSYDSWAAYVNKYPLRAKSYVLAYGKYIYVWGPRVGVDPAIALAQSHVETFNLATNCPYDSDWVLAKGNMVGMGIVGSPSDSDSPDFRNDPERMAKSHIAHLSLYAKGAVQPPLTSADDTRYDAYIGKFGARAMAPTIAGLSSNWAEGDTEYGNKIVARSQIIWPNGLEYYVVNTTYGVPAKLTYPDGTPWDGKNDLIWYGTIIYAQRRTVTALAGGQARVNGSLTGTPTRTPFKDRETFRVLGYFYAGADTNGENRYWLSDDWSRVHVAGTIDKPITLKLT